MKPSLVMPDRLITASTSSTLLVARFGRRLEVQLGLGDDLLGRLEILLKLIARW